MIRCTSAPPGSRAIAATWARRAYSSHPSVSTLAPLGAQAPVAFLGAGALETGQPPPQGVELT